jgi:hypothetical protein
MIPKILSASCTNYRTFTLIVYLVFCSKRGRIFHSSAPPTLFSGLPFWYQYIRIQLLGPERSNTSSPLGIHFSAWIAAPSHNYSTRPWRNSYTNPLESESHLHWCLLPSVSMFHTGFPFLPSVHLLCMSEPITESLTKQVLYICSGRMWCLEIITNNLKVTAYSLPDLDGKFWYCCDIVLILL